MRKALMAMAAAAGLAHPAMATPGAAFRFNPRAPENNRVLATFNYANVESVLNAIGVAHRRVGETPGKPALLVAFPNGRRALLLFGSCTADGKACTALGIQSFWTRIANAPPGRTTAAIEDFNRRYSFAKAYVGADGRPVLQRYLVADYGFIRGNLAVNLLAFADQAERLATEVLGPLEAGKK